MRLEAIRVGGGWVTTPETFARFCRELTLVDDPTTSDVGTSVVDDGAANDELERSGW